MFEKTVRLMEQALQNQVFPSAALAVGVREKVLLSRCWGKTGLFGPADAITPDTLYDMASLSKVLGTTMAAFRLMEDGALCLDSTVGDFFDAGADHRSITIRQLMTHTSGIAAHFYLSDFTQDPADAARVILERPLDYPTGSETVYSCMGYILLGKILEKITGLALDQLVEKCVFQPLAMRKATYHPAGSVACTERDPLTGRFLCGVVHDENARFLGGISGNAGIFSTLGDMVKFASMLACEGRSRAGAYLTPSTMRAATHNYTPGMAQNRGLGFQLAGSGSPFMGDLFGPGSFGHTGFTGTSLAVDPENGLFVILLTNRVHPTRENVKLIRFRNLLHNCIAAEFSRF